MRLTRWVPFLTQLHCFFQGDLSLVTAETEVLLSAQDVRLPLPCLPVSQDTFNIHNPPSQILKFEEDLGENVSVENPGFDYIPPELVNLFITNLSVLTCMCLRHLPVLACVVV